MECCCWTLSSNSELASVNVLLIFPKGTIRSDPTPFDEGSLVEIPYRSPNVWDFPRREVRSLEGPSGTEKYQGKGRAHWGTNPELDSVTRVQKKSPETDQEEYSQSLSVPLPLYEGKTESRVDKGWGYGGGGGVRGPRYCEVLGKHPPRELSPYIRRTWDETSRYPLLMCLPHP